MTSSTPSPLGRELSSALLHISCRFRLSRNALHGRLCMCAKRVTGKASFLLFVSYRWRDSKIYTTCMTGTQFRGNSCRNVCTFVHMFSQTKMTPPPPPYAEHQLHLSRYIVCNKGKRSLGETFTCCPSPLIKACTTGNRTTTHTQNTSPCTHTPRPVPSQQI